MDKTFTVQAGRMSNAVYIDLSPCIICVSGLVNLMYNSL